MQVIIATVILLYLNCVKTGNYKTKSTYFINIVQLTEYSQSYIYRISCKITKKLSMVLDFFRQNLNGFNA